MANMESQLETEIMLGLMGLGQSCLECRVQGLGSGRPLVVMRGFLQ